MGNILDNSSDIYEQGAGGGGGGTLTLPYSQTASNAGVVNFEIINSNIANDSHGIQGKTSGASGISAGVRGETNSSNGYGVYGISTTAGGVGVQGVNQNTGGTAVLGDANGDNGIGVLASGDGALGTTGHRALVASLQNTSAALGIDVDFAATVTSSTGMRIDVGSGANNIAAEFLNGFTLISPGGTSITPTYAQTLYQDTSDSIHSIYQNSTTGNAANQGFLVGLSSAEEAELVNFQNTAMLFKTNNVLAAQISASQQFIVEKGFQIFGNNTGRYDATIIKTGLVPSTAQDLAQVLDTNGLVITGMYDLLVHIVGEDATRTNVDTWLYRWGWANGGTEQFNQLGSTAKKGTTGAVPGTAADGAGRKLRISTGAVAIDCTVVIHGIAMG